jgi:hypothetical protein
VNAYMKAISVILLLSITAAPVAAQHGGDREKRVQRATRKMWLGSGMMVAGAIIAPITATKARDQANVGLVGLGVVAVGTVVLWSGAQSRRKALQPNTTLRLQLGRTAAVQFQRVW